MNGAGSSAGHVPLAHSKFCRWVRDRRSGPDQQGCTRCRYLAGLLASRPGADEKGRSGGAS